MLNNRLINYQWYQIFVFPQIFGGRSKMPKYNSAKTEIAIN